MFGATATVVGLDLVTIGLVGAPFGAGTLFWGAAIWVGIAFVWQFGFLVATGSERFLMMMPLALVGAILWWIAMLFGYAQVVGRVWGALG